MYLGMYRYNLDQFGRLTGFYISFYGILGHGKESSRTDIQIDRLFSCGAVNGLKLELLHWSWLSSTTFEEIQTKKNYGTIGNLSGLSSEYFGNGGTSWYFCWQKLYHCNLQLDEPGSNTHVPGFLHGCLVVLTASEALPLPLCFGIWCFVDGFEHRSLGAAVFQHSFLACKQPFRRFFTVADDDAGYCSVCTWTIQSDLGWIIDESSYTALPWVED